MVSLQELMKLLDVSESDAIKAILNLVSPPPPPATRQNWTRLSTFGNSAPTTKDLWKKTGEFPALKKLIQEANVKQVGGATYLLKFIENRLDGIDNHTKLQ